jgi:hypothetical protein
MTGIEPCRRPDCDLCRFLFMGAVLEETVFEEDIDQLPAPDVRQIIAEIAYDRISEDRRGDSWPVDDWTHFAIADDVIAALTAKGLLR